LPKIIFTICILILSFTNSSAQQNVDLSIDPSLLQYQFKTFSSIELNSVNGEYFPSQVKGQVKPGAYEVANHWRNDTLSFIIFWRDFINGGAINQVNRNIWSIMSTLGGDFDQDSVFEVAMTYQVGDEIWIEIVESGGKVEYKKVLHSVEDNNRNGRWDGSCILAKNEDINGDGCSELLLTSFSGFDLYPRSYFCLDWLADTILWTYDISGMPAGVRILQDPENGQPLILCGSVSMGNPVYVDSMSDQYSYLICLDKNGNELWNLELGGVFSQIGFLPMDYAGDGTMDLLTYTNYSQADTISEQNSITSMLRVYSLDGNLLKELPVTENASVRQVIKGNINLKEEDEIILSTSDGIITIYNQELNILERYNMGLEVQLWKCSDYLANGKCQLIASTAENNTILLDNNFKMLALCEYKFNFQKSSIIKSDPVSSSATLLLNDPDKSQMLVMVFEKQPFLSILKAFVLKHQQSIFVIIGLLVSALVFTNYHRRKVKRNLELISKQRDELEKTRNDLQMVLKDLKEAQTRLVQSEKMASLSMLVAGIAHEINNAIGALTSHNNTATRAIGRLRPRVNNLSGSDDEKMSLVELLDVAENSNQIIGDGADKIADIVRRLRSFARLDEAELQRVDINECLSGTIELLHEQFKQNILVNKDFGELPGIACYPSQLNQVFLNLLMNAKEAIRKRGEITIKTYQENNAAIISIADTGTGIPDENLSKIFDPGFTTKGVGVGTGLGLAICYQIIQDHQGEITVKSEPDKGTNVIISLPIKA
jgi:signal transduction histidine kinase